jgi:TfoX/Sxy family transcriptional regulator of competence genes
MAYDEGLAQRIREHLAEVQEIEEKKMFGGIGYLLRGNMACGVIGEDLIVRVGPDNDEDALRDPHARPFDFTGRVMRGWVMVGPAGHAEDNALASWVQRGLKFAASLPAK